MTRRSPVAPVLLGPGNALAAVGAPWRWVRDTARGLGVRFVGAGKKRFVPAAEFLAALERSGIPLGEAGPGAAQTASDPAEAVRRALGRRRRTASPARTAENQLDSKALASDCPTARPGRAA